MGKAVDELFEDIYNNVKEDREMLRSAVTTLLEAAGDESIALASVSEAVAKMVDSMTKANSQLVELAKIKSRREAADSDDFSENEAEEVFSEIEGN